MERDACSSAAARKRSADSQPLRVQSLVLLRSLSLSFALSLSSLFVEFKLRDRCSRSLSLLAVRGNERGQSFTGFERARRLAGENASQCYANNQEGGDPLERVKFHWLFFVAPGLQFTPSPSKKFAVCNYLGVFRHGILWLQLAYIM